ncbi:MAG TPA: MFS transporter [Stellaceae bacterium]|jgi:DHA1 family multidrug resistance protein-like MFS transporter
MAEERIDPVEDSRLTQPSGQWQRTLWAMVGIQLVMTMSFSMLSPIMPLFLPQLGVHSASAVDLWAGILSGITSLVAAFASPLWGRLADRRGRKLMLLRSSLAIGVFAGLMGLAANVWQFFACRALMGVFAGFSSSAIALVASQAPEARLGFALGWLATGQLVGSLIGPLLGGALADATHSYRIPFYCTGVTVVMSTLLVWFGVHERFVAPPRTRGGRSLLSSLLAVARSPGLLPLFFVLLMAQFGVRTVQPVVTLFVKELVGMRPDLATLSGIAFSVTGLADVVASPFLGKRSDVLGYRRVLLISLLGATLTTLPQTFVGNYWVFTAERFGVGMFIGGILPTANALVGRLVPRAQRGTVYGITASAMFLGNSLGPLSGGAVAAAFGLRWVFLVTGAVLLANLVWVYYRVPEYAEAGKDGEAA